jgi:DNA-binding transcriptional ArsR family regulator/uncharacterized coiled-coil protein SlyX
MSSSEEDSYSMIFSSLKHPIRRKILRILSSEAQTFSDLQKQFKIESSHLTYHIDGLGNLLYKTEDGKYALSSLGEAAVSMMRNVEEPPATLHLPFTHARSNTSGKKVFGRAVAIALGIICIILAAALVGAFAYYVPMVNSKDSTISSLNSEVMNLQNQIASDNTSMVSLQNQIDSLQSQITELEKNASSDNAATANLNSTLTSLNAQITKLTDELNQFETWVLNETMTLLNQTQTPMAQGNNDELQLTMTLEKPLFRLGELIDITLTITDITNQTVSFNHFDDWWNFLVYNITNQGENGLATWVHMTIPHGEYTTLSPGMNVTESLSWPQTCNATLDQYGLPIDPVSPGTYYIVGMYDDFGRSFDYNLQTTPIQIIILPF